MSNAANPAGGLAYGAFVFREGHDAFVLAGGFAYDAGVVASDEVLDLSLSDLGSGFSYLATLPDIEGVVELDADERCQETTSITCWTITEEGACYVDFVEQADRCANLWTRQEDCGEDREAGTMTGFWAGCAEDPYCTGDADSVGDSMSLPGRAELAAVYDPIEDTVWIHGGTAGCEGPSCSAWESARIYGDDELSTDRYMLNATDVLELNPTDGSISSLEADLDPFYPDAWPEGHASWGVRMPGVGRTGIEWSLANREFEAGSSFQAVLVGGTVHQSVSPNHDWTLIETSTYNNTECNPDYPVYDAGEWSAYQPFSYVSEGIVPEEDSFATFSPATSTGTYSGLYLSGSFDERRAASVAAIGEGSLLVVGGMNASSGDLSSVSQVDISGNTATVSSAGWLSVGRRNPGLAYDPIERTAYAFGGHASDAEIDVLPTNDAEAPNATSTFETASVEVSLVSEAVASTADVFGAYPFEDWSVGTTLELTHQCEGDGCWADEVRLSLVSNGVPDPRVKVTYGDGWSGTAQAYDVQVGDYVYVATVRLPRVLADGDALTLAIHWDDVPAEQGLWADAQLIPLQSFAYGDASQIAYRLHSVPALVYDGTMDALASRLDVVGPLSYTIDVPDLGNTQVVGPGEWSLSSSGSVLTGTLSGGPNRQATDSAVYVFQDIDEMATHTVGSTTHRVLVDPEIAGWELGLLYDFLNGTSLSTLDGTLADVEAHLGTSPVTDHTFVYRRNIAGSPSTAGLHTSGVSLVIAYSAIDGEVREPLTDNGPFAITAHEYAHTWFGEDLRFADGADWLVEAVPEALEWRLYPHPGGASRSMMAVDWTIKKTMKPAERIDTDLTLWSYGSPAPYLLGAYTLIQAQFLSAPTTADHGDFWAAIASWQGSFPANAEATPEDVEDLFEVSAGLYANFYEEWVSSARVGTPLLAITGYTWDAGTRTGSVSLDQIQTTLLGASWTTYTEVPYVLTAWRNGMPSAAAFTELPSAAGVSAATVGAAGTTETFALSASIPVGAVMPAMLRLHHSYRLLPSSGYIASSYNGTPSEQLVCGGAVTGPCAAPDADGDGWVDPTDCGAADNTIYPFWTSPDESPSMGRAPDSNCDGWSY